MDHHVRDVTRVLPVEAMHLAVDDLPRSTLSRGRHLPDVIPARPQGKGFHASDAPEVAPGHVTDRAEVADNDLPDGTGGGADQ